LVGLATMLLSSNVMVWGAKEVAAELGMSQLFIGLTIVAIGTSLPELAASVAGALRGHHDIAIGNVFGSNMFNFLLVMPTAGVISPLDLDSVVFFRDYGAVCVFTVILVGAIYYQYLFKKPGMAYLSRRFGALMLIGYVIYFILLLPTR
jgi:cation:H+ antiporter